MIKNIQLCLIAMILISCSKVGSQYICINEDKGINWSLRISGNDLVLETWVLDECKPSLGNKRFFSDSKKSCFSNEDSVVKRITFDEISGVLNMYDYSNINGNVKFRDTSMSCKKSN